MSDPAPLSNYARLSEGLRIYRDAMRALVARRLRQAVPRGDWFAERVLTQVVPKHKADLEHDLAQARAAGRLGRGQNGMEQVIDIQHLPRIIAGNWNEVFAATFKNNRKPLNFIRELGDERNPWAHPPLGDSDPRDVDRVLDTCELVLEYVDPEAAKQVHALRLAGAAPAPAVVTSTQSSARRPESSPSSSVLSPESSQSPVPTDHGPRTTDTLKPWRDVIAPHPDVQLGRYHRAEFAADLHLVESGKATAEYADAAEFFRRTFMTREMERLLVGAVSRLRGDHGDPVVDLKTAFGGGKSHTLLAAYHIAKAAASPQTLAGAADVQRIFEQAGGPPPPDTKVAILVGTHLDPVTPCRIIEEAGNVEVRTLWGEMAYQLAGFPGYQLLQDHDDRGIAPGAEKLAELFRLAGPSLVLIDELVAYLRNVPAGRAAGVPAGSFNAQMTFCQALTEAAKAAPNVVVLVSVPASDIEYGDDRGRSIAERISNVFQRIGPPWQPVGGHEAFEVVRRRLFGEVRDPQARDRTCEAFYRYYRDNVNDFPSEAREPAYLERLKASYPIHPEVFERLYVDWAGNIDRFQRTRGVLALMADAIHKLWVENDQQPLITPGSLPMYHPPVRQQLIGYLEDAWNGPFDADIDGETCEACNVERASRRFAQVQACRRLTRTIFLGSVPGKAHVGLETARIMLGAVQPGEGVAVYGDALRTLANRLSFLYGSDERYWFEVRPNLNKVAADRIARISDEDARDELRNRLKNSPAFKDKADFVAVHPAPRDPAEIADEAAARLVLLDPAFTYPNDNPRASALRRAGELLDSRGNAPRTHKNMLVFLAADADLLPGAIEETKRYLGWKSIAADGESGAMQLDRPQQAQAARSRDEAGKTVDTRLEDAYRHLLVPEQTVDPQNGPQPLVLKPVLLTGGTLASLGNPARKAGTRLISDGLLITTWAPIHLKRELDAWVWKDGSPHAGLKQVWNYLATYPYFSRLRDVEVLKETVKAGVRSRDYFGYADGVGDNGRYLGLVFAEPPRVVVVDDSSVLVRPEVAAAQTLEPSRGPLVDGSHGGETGGGTRIDGAGSSTAAAPPEPKRFYGTVKLNPARLGSSAGQIGDEIVQHLNALLGARAEIVLEIHVDVPNGIPDHVQRTVSENARTLRFDHFEFSEE